MFFSWCNLQRLSDIITKLSWPSGGRINEVLLYVGLSLRKRFWKVKKTVFIEFIDIRLETRSGLGGGGSKKCS